MEAPETKFKPSKVGRAPFQYSLGRAPFQYSLRTMFIVMTVLAIGVSLLFAAPPIVQVVSAGFFLILLPMVLTVAIIYGRGYGRTFCIGAIFPAGVAIWPVGYGVPLILYGMDGMDDVGYGPGIWVGVAFAVSMLFGLIAMGVRWMIQAPQRQQEREAFLREQTSPAPGREDARTPES